MVEHADSAMSATTAETKVRRLACTRCGSAFDCGSGGRDGGCWCADEPCRLPMSTTGEDCLCPTCLRRLAFVSGQSA
jgi:hypothetical protein